MKPILLLLALATFAFPQEDAVTDLTDKSGRTITARILKIENETVEILRASDEEPFSIPLARLDEASREAAITIDSAINPRVVKVSNLVIKKVGGKFRYFFDIRNLTPEPFEGKVEITLLNAMAGITNGSEIFATRKPMEPGLGFVGFIQAGTGPKQIHGDASVAQFAYIVYGKDGKEIRRARGTLSAKFEDLD